MILLAVRFGGLGLLALKRRVLEPAGVGAVRRGRVRRRS